MRRPDRNLVLSMLACAAAFAQGWQQERDSRIAARAAAPVPSIARPPAATSASIPPRRAATAAAGAAAVATLDEDALFALLDALADKPVRDWTDGEVDRLYAMLAAGSAEAGDYLAMRCRADGDCKRLRAALQARATDGDANAASLLADLYADDDLPGADPALAFAWMARYAELGDPDAKVDAAMRTLYRAPVDRAEWRAQALAWLATAAEGGSMDAALELIELADGAGKGFGVEPDAAATTRWYELVLARGDPQVLRQAAIHFQSRGDAEGTARAVELWTQQGEVGGEFGSNNAAWLLAVCGSALPDYEQAWRLIQLEHRDHGESWQSVDTLAAVQARLGMWGDALATQQRALDLLEANGGEHMSGAERELRDRLAGYAALQPPAEAGLCAPSP